MTAPSHARGLLLVLGAHKGEELAQMTRGYRRCIAFEANPDCVAALRERFKSEPHVEIIHAAVTTFDGEVTFNVLPHDSSSSLGTVKRDYSSKPEFTAAKAITVPAVLLPSFLRTRGIERIDDYLSDLQGMDLEILKTMREYIEARRIDAITAEVTKDEKVNMYDGLPSNRKSEFFQLLGPHYVQVAEGWGSPLADWTYRPVKDSWWEMDCKWRRRTPLLALRSALWRMTRRPR